MENNISATSRTVTGIVLSLLGGLFVVTGILNLFLVHPVPGAFYLLLSFLYLPYTNRFLKQKFGFIIPAWVKIIIGLVVLWGTLAVTDLAEILGL